MGIVGLKIPGLLIIWMILIWSPSVVAAEIDGYAWVAASGQRTAAVNATVYLYCGNNKTPTNEDATDHRGRYRIADAKAGACWIEVDHQSRRSTKVKVYPSDEGTSVNLELQADETGWSLTLR